MVNCSNCGFDVGENTFCPNCGSQVENGLSSLLCSNCGFDVGDSVFCPNCGMKVEEEVSSSLCSNCGFDAGDSNFCPNCGSKMIVKKDNNYCPNCGSDVGDSAFCPKCGTEIHNEYKETFKSNSEVIQYDNGSPSTLDKASEIAEKVSGKVAKLMNNSKSMDFVYDKTANVRRKNIDQTMEFYASNEPEFLEVYNSIDEDLLKSLLALEREKLGSVGGGVVGSAMSSVYVPTKDMDYDESIQFYIDIVNRIVDEINIEKQKGNFNEDEYYKQKYKQSNLENISSAPILKVFKAMKK